MYTYNYPRPSVAVDVVVFCIDEYLIKKTRNTYKINEHKFYNYVNVKNNIQNNSSYIPPLDILLIKRKNPPFQDCFALPGGFIDEYEETSNAATRELFEETNLKLDNLQPIFFASNPYRDPRGRCISLIYGALISKCFDNNNIEVTAGDDAKDVKWFSLRNLPNLAFDHRDIIFDALSHLKWQALNAIIGKRVIKSFWTKEDVNSLHYIITNNANDVFEKALALGFISFDECGKLKINFENNLKNWQFLVW